MKVGRVTILEVKLQAGCHSRCQWRCCCTDRTQLSRLGQATREAFGFGSEYRTVLPGDITEMEQRAQMLKKKYQSMVDKGYARAGWFPHLAWPKCTLSHMHTHLELAPANGTVTTLPATRPASRQCSPKTRRSTSPSTVWAACLRMRPKTTPMSPSAVR